MFEMFLTGIFLNICVANAWHVFRKFTMLLIMLKCRIYQYALCTHQVFIMNPLKSTILNYPKLMPSHLNLKLKDESLSSNKSAST